MLKALLLSMAIPLTAAALSPAGYLDLAPQYVFGGFNKGATGTAPVRQQAPAGCAADPSCAITLTSVPVGQSIFTMCFSASACTTTDNGSGGSNTYSCTSFTTSATNVTAVTVCYALNITHGSVTTVTPASGGGTSMIGFAAVYTHAGGGVDVNSGNNTISSTSYTSNATSTTAVANELWIGVVGTGNSTNAHFAAGSGWVYPTAHVPNNADGDDAVWQEKIVSSTGTCTANGTSDSEADPGVPAICVTFKAN